MANMVVDANWVELKTEDGRTYFWNRKANSREWKLPEGITVKWVGQKSPDGRTYYWSRDTKETVWVLPALTEDDIKDAANSGQLDKQVASPTSAATPQQHALATGAAVAASGGAIAGATQEEPEPPLLCSLPETEPPGPAGDNASAVAARHVIERSGCDTWFLRTLDGDWEEVVRFWPAPADLVVKKPKLRRPKPDPYGIRDVVLRCQRHEEMVKALLATQFGSITKFSPTKYPTPKASDWCFWTQEGEQIIINADGAQKGSDRPVRRSPPEGERWKMMKPNLRNCYSMVYKAKRLRRLEKLIKREQKVAVQDLLDDLGSEGQVPDKLLKFAQTLLAPPPKQPPMAGLPGVSPMEPMSKATGGPPQVGEASEVAAGLAVGQPGMPAPFVKGGIGGMPPAPAGGMQMAPLQQLTGGVPPPQGIGLSPPSAGITQPGMGTGMPPAAGVAPLPQGMSQPGFGMAVSPVGGTPAGPGSSGRPVLQLASGASLPPKMGPPLGMEPGAFAAKADGPLPSKQPPAKGMMPPPPAGTSPGDSANAEAVVFAAPQTKSSSFAKGLSGPPPKEGFFGKAPPQPAVGSDGAVGAPIGGGDLPVKGKGPPPAAHVGEMAASPGPSAAAASSGGTSEAPAANQAAEKLASPASTDADAGAGGPQNFAAKQPPPQGLPLPTAPGTAAASGPAPGLPAPTPSMPAVGGCATAPIGMPLMGGMPTAPTGMPVMGGMPLAAGMTMPMTMPGGMLPGVPTLPGGMPMPFKAAFPGGPVPTGIAPVEGMGLPPTKAPPAWKAPPLGSTMLDTGLVQQPPMKAAPPAGMAEAITKEQLAPREGLAAALPDAGSAAVAGVPSVAAVAADATAPAATVPMVATAAASAPVATPPAAVAASADPSAAAAADEAPWVSRKRRRAGAARGETSTDAGPVAALPKAANADSGETVAASGAPPKTAQGPPAREPVKLPSATSDRAAAARVAAQAQRLAAATGADAASRVGSADDVLKRKVTVSNIPAPAKSAELSEFFTGAIFSASGHTLAAQWQSGEASKVVLGVDLLPGTPFGATAAEITFGTQTGATVAIALNGIQFKDKPLEIRRPQGYAPEKGKARTKLQGISIKDLVAGGGSEGNSDATAPSKKSNGNLAGAFVGAAAGATNDAGTTACVQLNGIPSSMSSKSVFDLLQQFGGPLKSLNLIAGKDGNEHAGHGSAEYIDRNSAVEAVNFSPLLGFIEVKFASSLQQAAGGTIDLGPSKRQRKSRFDPTPQDDDEDDGGLGPFEAVLQQAGRPAPSKEAADLGPFEAVLPPAKRSKPAQATDDLGPFEAVFAGKPPASGKQPAARKATAAASGVEDLGPFEAVLSSRPGTAAADPVQDKPPLDDLGPFAGAVQSFSISRPGPGGIRR